MHLRSNLLAAATVVLSLLIYSSATAQESSGTTTSDSQGTTAGAQNSTDATDAQSSTSATTQSDSDTSESTTEQSTSTSTADQTSDESDASQESADDATSTDSDDSDRATSQPDARNRSRASTRSSTSSRTRLSTQGLDSDSDSDTDTDADSDLSTRAQSRSRTRSGQLDARTRTRLNNQDLDSDTEVDADAFNQDDQDSETDASASRRARSRQDRRDESDISARSRSDDQDQSVDADASAEVDQDSTDDSQSRTRRQTRRDTDSTSADAQRRQTRTDRTRRSQRDSDRDTDFRAEADADVDVDADADADVDAEIRSNLGAQFSSDNQDRLTISSLQRDSVLAQAGLRRGDVLISVLDQPVSSVVDFREIVTNADPGDRIPLIVLRNGRQQRIFVDADQFVSLRSFDTGSRLLAPFGIRLDSTVRDRLVISSIAPNSFLVRSGLRPGDIITMVSGQPITTIREFRDVLVDADPGQRIPVEVLRDDREVTLYVTARDIREQDSSYREGRAWLGVYFDTRYDSNAVVESVHPDSPAEQAGIRAGDVIVRANGQRIRSGDELTQLISDLEPGQELDLEVSRRMTRDLQATLGERPEESDMEYRSRARDSDADVEVIDDDYEINTRRGDIRYDDEIGPLDTGDRDGRLFNRDERPGFRVRGR